MTEGRPAGAWSLREARAWLLERLDRGVDCPCCGQFAKRYTRRLNKGMAYALVVFYNTCGREWGYKPDVLRGVGSSARDEALLRHWGLFEESNEERDDGGRAGWWRVTAKGEQFVLGEITVQRQLVIYNNAPQGFAGKPIDIRAALGFRLDVLMADRPWRRRRG